MARVATAPPRFNRKTDWDALYRERMAASPLVQRARQSVRNLNARNVSRSGAAPTLSQSAAANKLKSGNAYPTSTAGGGYGDIPTDPGYTPGAPLPTTPTTPGTGTPTTPPNETPPPAGAATDNPYAKDMDKTSFWRGGKPINSNADWMKGISDVMLDQVVNDSPQATAQWAMHGGYGRGLEGALNRMADPSAFALAGAGGVGIGSSAELGGFIGGWNQAMMNNTGGSTVDPRALIKRTLMATADVAAGDALGLTLYGGANADLPAKQVDDTIRFLRSALPGFMPGSTIGAYTSLLERLGREFLAWKSTPAGVGTHKNFGAYVLDRTNGTGGI